MEANGIVPDVIDTVPTHTIQINYAGNLQVNMGNELTPLQVKDAPISISWKTKEETLNTLVMVDPDAPSRQDKKYGPIKHWLVVNIPSCNVSEGLVLATYAGSKPPPGSGLHRYVFLVYKQEGRIIDEQPIPDGVRELRRNFDVREFAKKHNLHGPYAGNFFQAQTDDYARNFWEEQAKKGQP